MLETGIPFSMRFNLMVVQPSIQTVRTLLSAEPITPLWRHCLVAFLTVWITCEGLMTLAVAVMEGLGLDVDSMLPYMGVTTLDWINAVVCAPVIETLILGLGLKLLSLASKRRDFLSFASAILWGFAHASTAAPWFISGFLGFYVFSCSYLAWRGTSFRNAFIAAAVPHSLGNFFTDGNHYDNGCLTGLRKSRAGENMKG